MSPFSKLCTLLLCAVLAVCPLTACHRTDEQFSASSQSSISSSEPAESRPPDYPVSVFGMQIQQQPERVVSLSPMLTELLCAFGYGEKLFGVSDYCDYPDSVMGVTTCGSALHPNLETIRDLRPDCLLTATPLQQKDRQQLEDMGILVIEITAPSDFDEVFTLYSDICLLMEGVSTGSDISALLTEGYRGQLEALEEKVSQDPLANTLSAVWVMEADTPIIAQEGSFYGEILSILCLKNAAQEGIDQDTSPDLVLYGDTVLPEELAASPLFGSWEAVSQNRLVEIPLAPFERCSPRMFDLLTALADEIYTTAAQNS